MNGNNTLFGKTMYNRIVEEGHGIGNHTYSHSYEKIYASIEDYWREHKKLEDLLYEVTGIRPKMIRFPGGSNNSVSHRYSDKNFMKKLIQRMEDEGYQYFDWNVTSKDASEKTPSKDIIIQSVLTNVENKDNAIILFHDSGPKITTVEALPVIIEELKKRGFEFDILSMDSFNVHF